jgi:hypothetical protein
MADPQPAAPVEDGDAYAHEPKTGLVGLLERGESWAGILVGWFMLLTVVGGVLWALLDTRRDDSPTRFPVIGLAAVAWLTLDLPYAVRLYASARSGRHPVGLLAVGRVPPPLLRLPVMLWWLAHFLAMGLIIILTERGAFGQPAGASATAAGRTSAQYFGVFAFAFVFAYVCNGFLLLTLRAMGLRRKALAVVWRNRLLVDASVALVGALLPSA